MNFPRSLATAAALAAVLQGCALQMIDRITKPEDLSPAQIKAFSEMGMTTYACFSIGGPPVGGNASIVLWPKNQPFTQQFGPNCTIIPNFRIGN